LYHIFSFQDCTKIAGNNATADRYGLLLSDGRRTFSFAMLATELNDKVASGELCDFTVIQITEYITSWVANAGKGEEYVT
jgi:replication factor A1